MKKNILFLLLCALCTTSCLYEDLGNYDYNKLPEVVIEEVDGTYGPLIYSVDSLIITPKLFFGTDRESEFDCIWYRKSNNAIVKITNTAELRLLMNVAGMNHFIFSAKHRKTGFSKDLQVRCEVTASPNNGWFILKETTEGNTEMDILFREWIKTDPNNQYEKNTFRKDVMMDIYGQQLQGEPVQLDITRYPIRVPDPNDSTKVITQAVNVVVPMSREDLLYINGTDMSVIANYDKVFANPRPRGERRNEGLYSSNGTSTLVYNGGKLKFRMISASPMFMSEIQGDYSVSSNVVWGKTSRAGISERQIVYDRESSSFYHIVATSTYLGKCIQLDPINGFIASELNLNSDLLFFKQSSKAWRGRSGAGLSILRKKNDPDSIIMCHLDLGLLDNTPFNLIAKMDTLSAKEHQFMKAEHLALHQDGEMLYYAVNNKVSIFRLKDRVVIPTDLDFGTEVITWFKYVRFNIGTVGQFRFDNLFVATYDSASDTYKIYRYNVTGSDKVPVKVEKEFVSGKGKVHSLKHIQFTTAPENYSINYI